jgi:hypothetical protein
VRNYYVELPLAVRATIASGKISPFLTAGAAVGRLLSARHRLEFQHGGVTAFVIDRYEPFDAALTLGAGLSIDTGAARSVTIDLTYEHGLVNVLRRAPYTAMQSWRSRGLTITAGVLLPL